MSWGFGSEFHEYNLDIWSSYEKVNMSLAVHGLLAHFNMAGFEWVLLNDFVLKGNQWDDGFFYVMYELFEWRSDYFEVFVWLVG